MSNKNPSTFSAVLQLYPHPTILQQYGCDGIIRGNPRSSDWIYVALEEARTSGKNSVEPLQQLVKTTTATIADILKTWDALAIAPHFYHAPENSRPLSPDYLKIAHVHKLILKTFLQTHSPSPPTCIDLSEAASCQRIITFEQRAAQMKKKILDEITKDALQKFREITEAWQKPLPTQKKSKRKLQQSIIEKEVQHYVNWLNQHHIQPYFTVLFGSGEHSTLRTVGHYGEDGSDLDLVSIVSDENAAHIVELQGVKIYPKIDSFFENARPRSITTHVIPVLSATREIKVVESIFIPTSALPTIFLNPYFAHTLAVRRNFLMNILRGRIVQGTPAEAQRIFSFLSSPKPMEK
jgi:hypothetical protein